MNQKKKEIENSGPVPESGPSRFLRCISDSVSEAFNQSAEKIYDSIKKLETKNWLPEKPRRLLSGIEPGTVKKGLISAVFCMAATAGALMPGQALGLYGFAAALIGNRMSESRNVRSMSAVANTFLAAQYALRPERLAGVISAGMGALRGSALTMIPDHKTRLRNGVALTAMAISGGLIATSACLTGKYSELLLLPVFPVLADRMGDSKSHTARFAKTCAYTLTLAYGSIFNFNAGECLTSALSIGVIFKTAMKAGDFYKEGDKDGKIHTLASYFRSLFQDRLPVAENANLVKPKQPAAYTPVK